MGQIFANIHPAQMKLTVNPANPAIATSIVPYIRILETQYNEA
jgi:hypothetical protein